MKVYKDIVSLSVPFTIGVVIGNSLFGSIGGICFIPTICVSILCIYLCWFTYYKPQNLIYTIVLFVLTGLFCVVTYRLHSSFSINFLDFTFLAKHTQYFIDSIPFNYIHSCSVINAILLGNKQGLSKPLQVAFAQSGASHILALSGFHIGVIYLIVVQCLKILGNTYRVKYIRVTIIILFSCIYTLATGANPSLVRAFIFIVLNELAYLLCRKNDIKRTIFVALFIQVVITPDIITNIGFQLSYLAILGIAFIYPILLNWYPQDEDTNLTKIMYKVWNFASLSISCQILTAPLAWYYFHTFPKYFLITNFIALPLTTIIIICSLITIGLTFIGVCPSFIIYINDLLIKCLINSLELIAGGL